MRRKLKLASLDLIKRAGLFERVANSHWRQQRLLILCYHGISLEDEHLWRPFLYIQPALLEKRLEALHAMRCTVLPLAEALSRLQSADLPPRSVAITFDDGTFDFYKQAYPRLKQRGFPVTVYQTTYYTDHQMPVFNLICSYMLWKRRLERSIDARDLGLSESMDLRTELGRHRFVRGLIDLSERENLTGRQKNDLAARLAAILGIDYAQLVSRRILQLMNPQELAEASAPTESTCSSTRIATAVRRRKYLSAGKSRRTATEFELSPADRPAISAIRAESIARNLLDGWKKRK
jgi:hypothetical protein